MPKQLFRRLMRERRGHVIGSAEHEWRTRAARKYVWLMRGVPTNQWSELT